MRVCPHPVGEAVSGEDGPGLPVHVMAIGLVHVLSQAVNVGGWELGGQLQVLILEHQRSERGVQPECVQREEEMNKETSLGSDLMRAQDQRCGGQVRQKRESASEKQRDEGDGGVRRRKKK